MSQVVNVVHFPVSPYSTQAGSDLNNLKNIFAGAEQVTTTWNYFKYHDTNSGWGKFGYWVVGYNQDADSLNVLVASCEGMTNPPSGSGIAAATDPAPVWSGVTWTALGAPFRFNSKSGGGNGGGAVVAGSSQHGPNSPVVRVISADGSNAVSEFQDAVTVMSAAAANGVTPKYYKYIDSVSGSWQVSAVISAGSPVGEGLGSTINALAPTYWIVTMSGSPNPPSGSGQKAISFPSGFTYSWVNVNAPLDLRFMS